MNYFNYLKAKEHYLLKMDNYYIVNSYSFNTDDSSVSFVSSSDVFYSEFEAQKFKEFLDSSNSFENRVIYCIVKSDKTNEQHESTNTTKIIKMFKIFNYGKGYFMKCPRQNIYYGMSKIEDGRWNDNLGGWIFPSTCNLEKLSRLGEFTNKKFSANKKYNLRKRAHE